MKKLLLRGLAAALLLIGATSARAQQLEAAPLDPEVVTGVLDNGLTYYIRHNENPKGQADFYIAQKVGSVLEEENQRGLAHFLEHMCFNGTANYPGNALRTWLESKGVKFGANLNAYTGLDETVYNISNVPVSTTGVQDSCLLILRDWSCGVTLDPKEIDSERGVIHEEWRQAMGGSMRIIENKLPVIMGDSRYGHRLPLGTMEVVDNFAPKTIVDYYHTWYRPDQQAIIVTGDIDPAYIEGKIKEMFGNIPMPANAPERRYFDVEDNPGTIYAVGSDKEMQMPVVLMWFKSNDVRLPLQYRNTTAYFPVSYIGNMAVSMLNSRLSELANKPETEFGSANVSIGDFFVAKNPGALSIEIVAKDTDIVPAFTQAYREIMRAVKGGFTVGEYERARAEFLSGLEKMYNERNDRKTGSYSKELVQLFVNNTPMTGIETEKALYEQFAQMLTVDQINEFIKAVVTEDNRAVLALLPEAEGFHIPSEDDFAAAVEAVDAEELEPYKDVMREDPLIPALPKAGKIVKTQKLNEWDATEYTLSNGVKVIVKPTDFKANEIVMQAIAKGNAGASLGNYDAASVKYAPIAMSTNSLYDYSNSDIAKYLQGKQAAVGLAWDDYFRMFEGSTTVKDLPVMMELLYATFTGFGIRDEEFTATRDAMAGMLANQESNPQYIFKKKISEALLAAPSQQALTSADIKAADRETIVNIARGMMTNAADYTFVFTGNIDLATFVPLMEQYIATLPADAANATTTVAPNADFEMRRGIGVDTYTTKMETPQTWAFIAMTGKVPYTVENKLLASISAQILSKRLLNKVREELGATYSIGASGDLDRLAGKNATIQIGFPMKPEMKDQVLYEIITMIHDMADNVSDDELRPVIEYMSKNAKESLKENSEWAGAMAAQTLNGVNVFLTKEQVLPTITTQMVKDYMRRLINQGNYRVVLLDPEK